MLLCKNLHNKDNKDTRVFGTEELIYLNVKNKDQRYMYTSLFQNKIHHNTKINIGTNYTR